MIGCAHRASSSPASIQEHEEIGEKEGINPHQYFRESGSGLVRALGAQERRAQNRQNPLFQVQQEGGLIGGRMQMHHGLLQPPSHARVPRVRRRLQEAGQGETGQRAPAGGPF